jgi:hypothetical protein
MRLLGDSESNRESHKTGTVQESEANQYPPSPKSTSTILYEHRSLTQSFTEQRSGHAA